MFDIVAGSVFSDEELDASYRVIGLILLMLGVSAITIIPGLVFGIAAVITRFTDKYWSKQLFIVSALLTCVGIGCYLLVYFVFIYHK